MVITLSTVLTTCAPEFRLLIKYKKTVCKSQMILLCHQYYNIIKSTFARSNMISTLISNFCNKLDVVFVRSFSLQISDADLSVHRNHLAVSFKCRFLCDMCTSNQHRGPGPHFRWQSSTKGARKFKFWLF